jgi:hypothetical protein
MKTFHKSFKRLRKALPRPKKAFERAEKDL